MGKQTLAIKEQIVKTVVKSGNGGAVWVPKDWLGEEVVVILPEKPKFDVRERIIHLLEPYLKDIISVGLYGSYARNEQTKDSDVDVLVLTKDKRIKLDFKPRNSKNFGSRNQENRRFSGPGNRRISLESKDFLGEEKIEITSFPIDTFKRAIEKYPGIYYQMVQEAEPLINAYVIEELKHIKISKESFKEYLKETGEHLKSNKELWELDALDTKYLKSYSVLYSSLLRLRTLFIIKCILKKDTFSNKKFKNWVISQDLSLKEFEDCYKAYRLIRDNESTKGLRIKIGVAEKILNILEKELRELEAQIYGK